MNSTESYAAVILDLDGVITATRSLHFAAWKETLDPLTSFNEKDYEKYVDGKPREEGLRTFLQSRHITLENDELRSLSEKKNALYLKALDEKGLVIFSDALRALNNWKSKKIPLAVVSSSKNTSKILDRLGIKHYFDVQIDALVGANLNLKGKPAPDYFLEAAKQLGKSPKECAVVEDAVAGIEAGIGGKFKSVIGIYRPGQTSARALEEAGADFVVTSLEEIFALKPNALQNWNKFQSIINGKELALFLDFDGTLSEIVTDFHQAKMLEPIKQILEKTAKSIKIAILSGRDRQDVKARVGVDNLFFAGCHGYDISGPGCFHFQVEEAESVVPEIEKASDRILELAENYEGLRLEKKKYFTAVHFRGVDSNKHPELKSKIKNIIESFENLEARHGKMVIEVAPKISWNKSEAVKKLCEVLELNHEQTVAVYLGDDLTDEDIFCELKSWGVGIKVGVEKMDGTCADFSLKNPEEVGSFLAQVEETYSRREKQWRRGA